MVKKKRRVERIKGIKEKPKLKKIKGVKKIKKASNFDFNELSVYIKFKILTLGRVKNFGNFNPCRAETRLRGPLTRNSAIY